MGEKKKMGIATKTLIALIAGILTGILIHKFYGSENISDSANYFIESFLINGVFLVLGNGFINLLKMIVVPLVFASLVTGTMSIGDTKKIGKIGGKTVLFYLSTTALAIIISMSIATIIKPGLNLDLSSFNANTEIVIAEKESLTTTLLNFIPDNPIASMANGDMIPIIIFAVIFGLGITKISADHPVITRFFIELNDVMMNITMMVMSLAPIGVFCLVAKTFSALGIEALLSLIKYFGSVMLALGVQCFIIYSIFFFVSTRLNPIKFFKKFTPVMAFAFSTSSSNATIPLTIEALETKIGVPRKISSFTIPLGATVNMDGTSIMQGVAVIFTAQAYGIDLSMIDYLTVIATATLASIGTAGIPSVGLIMLSMVLTSVGLPVEAIGIIMGVDRLLDMTRTAVNVTGDAICTTIISIQEKVFDYDIFNS